MANRPMPLAPVFFFASSSNRFILRSASSQRAYSGVTDFPSVRISELWPLRPFVTFKGPREG